MQIVTKYVEWDMGTPAKSVADPDSQATWTLGHIFSTLVKFIPGPCRHAVEAADSVADPDSQATWTLGPIFSTLVKFSPDPCRHAVEAAFSVADSNP